MSADEKTAYHLLTPCGSITVRDDRNSFVPFAIRKSGSETAFEADSGRVYDTLRAYIISVPAARMEKGRVYRIALEGIRLGIGSTDECCACVVGSSADCSIAIGAADPNEPEKYSQYLSRRSAVDPPYSIASEYSFDRSGFARYDLHVLPDFSGFRFELLDDLCQEIVFPVAWIESRPDIRHETENAVQFRVL